VFCCRLSGRALLENCASINSNCLQFSKATQSPKSSFITGCFSYFWVACASPSVWAGRPRPTDIRSAGLAVVCANTRKQFVAQLNSIFGTSRRCPVPLCPILWPLRCRLVVVSLISTAQLLGYSLFARSRFVLARGGFPVYRKSPFLGQRAKTCRQQNS